MKRILGRAALTDLLLMSGVMLCSLSARAESPLTVVYPPPEHQTVAEKIFFIGTASPQSPVFINGKQIENRSAAGHFAPSLPLKMGENNFVIRHQEERIQLTITRKGDRPEVPDRLAFAPDSLTPMVDMARLPDEVICLSAVAPPDAKVSARIGNSKILLMPQLDSVELAPNSAVLTTEIPKSEETIRGRYEGCTVLETPLNYGKPIFELERGDRRVSKLAEGEIKILSPQDIRVVEVTADTGVARTGPSTDHSRLTPLPSGTKGRVTGTEGEWLRLDYGGWIKAEETQPVLGNVPPRSIIRGIFSRKGKSATEIIFPLQTPVPIEIEQQSNSITLTLHNTTAQTDTIRLDNDPIIERLDWQQVSPTRIDYSFKLKSEQQWGYDFRYEGSNLILSLRHPPYSRSQTNNQLEQLTKLEDIEPDHSLSNIKILIDPGHGGEESGARGPTGYPKKTLIS